LSQKSSDNYVSLLVPYLVAVAIALVAIGLLLAILGYNPVEGYVTMWTASFGSLGAVGVFVSRFVPLLLLGLAFALPMKTKSWNVGNEGQFLSGAIGATILAFSLPSLSIYLGLPLLLLAGILFGVLWSAVPALLLYKFRVNVVLSTIAMNFIAYQLVDLVALGPWHDPASSSPSTLMIPASYQIPPITSTIGDSLGLVIALILPLVVYGFVYRTVRGYEMRAVGDNPQAAFTFGIPIRLLAPMSILIAGGIAGLGGGIYLAGYQLRLVDGMQLQFGVLSQIIALISFGNPVGVLFTTVFISVTYVGSDAMQVTMGAPSSLVLVIEASILLLILLANILWKRSP
jgi:general nucleoside transport system permease protein